MSFRAARVESKFGPRMSIESEPETPLHTTFKPPKAQFTHTRQVSAQSMRFVDLLDAQSEIKPANFRIRVHAAGVRDYGEDVADRNIGENGVDLTSSKVQEFYASASPAPAPSVFSAQTDQSAPAPAVTRTLYDDEELYRPRRKTRSLADSGLRAMSLNSASFNPFPKRTTSFLPRESGSAPGPKKVETPALSQTHESRGRRQSVNSFASRGTTPTPRAKERSTSLHRSSLSAAETIVPTRQRQDRHNSSRPSTSYDRTGNDLGIYTPAVPKAASTRAALSPRLPRDSVLLAKKKHGGLTLDPAPSMHRNQQQSNKRPRSSARPNSRSGSAAITSFSSPNGKSPVKRHSMTSIIGDQASRRRPQSRGDWPRNSGAEGGHDGRSYVGRVEVEGPAANAGPGSPAPSPRS